MEEVVIKNCPGKRYIGAGGKNKKFTVEGVPGNALGCYLDGGTIEVFGNVQDAAGDTMNDGLIVVHGSAGDTLGYAMRGGKIFVRGDTGYRTGILLKEYKDKKPVIVVGGKTGDFLGEYLAGGVIIVLGLTEGGGGAGRADAGKPPSGLFSGSGMHGGKIFVRSETPPHISAKNVTAGRASPEELESVRGYIEEFGRLFKIDTRGYLKDKFYLIKLNERAKREYTGN